ncbi:GntR family transcriptional regulator [Rhizobium leguminosarum]|uniref:GntR family transcriptional regulator n=1 Tax=Rhizobium leguminosarum TaxID=384 RepID=UPI001F0BB95B|nr:GntR family transcriptional regulator [Rhizobium leguminosarum]MCH4549510.1 GntR family transcriptional regulator [Rhizobium changzhiense]
MRSNAFPPGYQAAEIEIARQLGMSRTPVHEAMARLHRRAGPDTSQQGHHHLCPVPRISRKSTKSSPRSRGQRRRDSPGSRWKSGPSSNS